MTHGIVLCCAVEWISKYYPPYQRILSYSPNSWIPAFPRHSDANFRVI